MQKIGEAYYSAAICVDSYRNAVLTGRLYDLRAENESDTFLSLIQLLTCLESRLNTANSPQSFTALRSFVPAANPAPLSPAPAPHRKGALATFLIRILFRQHSSWQGSVFWADRKSEQTFRSALELILLIDSALRENKEEQSA